MPAPSDSQQLVTPALNFLLETGGRPLAVCPVALIKRLLLNHRRVGGSTTHQSPELIPLLAGPFSRLPVTSTRDGFAGPWWYSGRWNHDADLAGKRVAVVGTEASAIQFVPEIAKVAGHVDGYQRSAPYVLPKADRLGSAGHRRGV
jgi:hypothetical protein